MKLKELEKDKRILVIGASGTGKTTIIGTLCKLIPTLVVTADINGLETLETMGVNPEVVFVKDWNRIYDHFGEIKQHIDDCLALAIDDLGAMQMATRHKIEKYPIGKFEEKAMQAKPAEFRESVRRELMLGERRMQIQQWGDLWIAMESFLVEALELPFAVKMVTVLEGLAENPRDNQQHIYPKLLGQTQTTIPARFSIVAEAFITEHEKKLYYCLSSRSHPKIETKDRFGGRTWVNPDMKAILAHMNRKGGEETELEKKIGIGLAI